MSEEIGDLSRWARSQPARSSGMSISRWRHVASTEGIRSTNRLPDSLSIPP